MGVFLRQFHQRNAHLLLTGFGLGFDGHTNHGLREVHGLKDDRSFFITQRITGGGVLQANHSGDIAGINLLNVLTVIGVHLNNTSNALFLPLGGVQNRRSGAYMSGIHADRRRTAHIGVSRNLERQCGERSIVIGMTLVLLISVRIDALNSRDIQREGIYSTIASNSF